MSITEFATAIVNIRRERRGSITSWGRTVKHAIAVGGFDGDPHTWDVGVDMVYDEGPNYQGHQPSPHHCEACSSHGVMVIHEKGHDHYQPMDFPAGSQNNYDGIRRDWK